MENELNQVHKTKRYANFFAQFNLVVFANSILIMMKSAKKQQSQVGQFREQLLAGA